MKNSLIFMDIDGTLVDKQMTISEADKQAVRKAINNGSKVYVATGRKYVAAKKIAQELHPAVQIIASNGCVYTWEDTFVKTSLNRAAVHTAYDIAQRKNLSLFLFGLSKSFYTKDLPSTFGTEDQARLASDQELQRIKITRPDDLDLVIDQIVNGILVSKNDLTILEEIKDELRESNDLSISSSNINNIELTPKGISKASAIAAIQKKYAIFKERTIAFGDGMNDIEMFGQARYSVAMGNAKEAVKAHANYETRANTDSGISYFLKRIYL